MPDKTAYEIAVELCAKYPERSLVLDILEYTRHHYCYFDPKCIILAKIEDGDTWFIYLAAGPGALSRFIDLAPFPLPYVSFARPEKKKPFTSKYSWAKLKRLCR